MFASSDMIRQWNENGKAYFPTFATLADLSAAVAANGGQSLGPSVSVAGVLWGNDGANNYSPIDSGVIARPASQSRTSAWTRYAPVMSNVSATDGPYTLVEQVSCNERYIAVRIGFKNFSTSTAAIGAAKIASVPTDLNNGVSGSPVWKNVTFGGATSGTIPASSGTGSDRIPGILYSDIIQIQAVARTDVVGGSYLLQLRTYYPNARDGFPSLTPNYLETLRTVTGNMRALDIFSGDAVSTISAKSIGTSSPYESAFSFDFYTGAKSLNIGFFGDSITAGATTTTNCSGWAHRACGLLQSSGVLMGISMHATNGQKHTPTYNTAIGVFATGVLNAATVFGWSPNDGSAQDDFDLMFVQALDLCERGIASGVIPILVSSPPNTGHSVAQSNMRIANNVRMEAAGFPFFDLCGIVADQSNPHAWASGYSNDGIHPNDTASAAIAPLFADFVMRIAAYTN